MPCCKHWGTEHWSPTGFSGRLQHLLYVPIEINGISKGLKVLIWDVYTRSLQLDLLFGRPDCFFFCEVSTSAFALLSIDPP